MSPVLYIFLYSPTKRWRGERNFLNGATHQFATFKTVLYTMNNSIRTIPGLQYAQLMILALRHNSSSSQHLCALPVQVTQSHSTDCLCGSHSIQTVTDELFHPPPTVSNASLLFQPLSPDAESLPCFSSLPSGFQPAELRDNTCLLFKPLTSCHFVMAALANRCHEENQQLMFIEHIPSVILSTSHQQTHLVITKSTPGSRYYNYTLFTDEDTRSL